MAPLGKQKRSNRWRAAAGVVGASPRSSASSGTGGRSYSSTADVGGTTPAGKHHHAAIRALAFKWQRILFRCWKDGVPYDDAKYMASLKRRNSPLLETTGFEMGEIDLMIENLAPALEGEDDSADAVPGPSPVRVSQLGDLWKLGKHRVFCGNALSANSYKLLMGDHRASVIFADPPYNDPIDGYVAGFGRIHHAEFAMASGEMSEAEFTGFLFKVFSNLARSSENGALQFICMDWRHTTELLAAGRRAFSEFKSLCVWVKDTGGQGSLYRSQHELVFVFKNGKGKHRNNIQLGQYGRYRTNVWQYPRVNAFARATEEGNLFALHPTVKPVALVADAILDCTARGEIVLDPFLGSGTTVIAAERTGRVCYGIELDPGYVDTIVRRWQAFTGKSAVHAKSARTFNEMEQGAKHEQQG